MYRVLLFVLLLLTGQTVAVEAVDDQGRTIRLERSASRIVALAPHATEMVYAAGAGRQLVGAVSYSDYPPAAKGVARVGGYQSVDLERIVALKPDLVIAWSSGNGERIIERLRELKLKVFVTEPRSIGMIADTVAALGKLAGSANYADEAAFSLRRRKEHLSRSYAGQDKVRVFYQVWNSPLMTVNGEHPISQVIRLCGGVNIFSSLSSLAPTVSIEGVLAANPEVIIGGGMGDVRPEWLSDWKRWPGLTAVERDNLYYIHPDLLQRSGPRLLDGAEQLCRALDRARQRRP